jgi:hypothetical protein
MSACYTASCGGCGGQFSVFHGEGAPAKCYWCTNGVEPADLGDSVRLVGQGQQGELWPWPQDEIDALAERLGAEGKDPTLAIVLLRKRAREARVAA